MNTFINNGFDFIEFITPDNLSLADYDPIKGSYIVIKSNNKYLMCYNKYRKQWELPAGKREEGETPLECALRELLEETSQMATNLTQIGLLKSINKQNGQIKYNPVFIGEINELLPFEENEEIAAITLWDLKTDIGQIDELDFRIFSFID